MTEKLFRVYCKLDLSQIKKNLLVYGDLGGSCENCQAIDIKLDQTQCPQCECPFKYIAFRNIKVHLPKVLKIIAQRPQMKIIDYDDYHRNKGASKAEDFFK